MMTNDSWYEAVDANIRLTQGDIINNCPVVRWTSNPVELKACNEIETLKSSVEAIQADVVVITQACDLENDKVRNVILCPHLSLDGYRQEWEKFMQDRGQTKLDKAWIKTCEDIRNGYIWKGASHLCKRLVRKGIH